MRTSATLTGLVLATLAVVAPGDPAADAVWEEQYKLIDRGRTAPSSLLRLYGCPHYDDRRGIRPAADAAAGPAAPPPPYSALPAGDEPWALFEAAYYHAVDLTPPPRRDEPPGGAGGGMLVPHEVRRGGDAAIGRGVYATRFVPAKTAVWAARRTVVFTPDRSNPGSRRRAFDDDGRRPDDGNATYAAYRRFLEYLHDPPEGGGGEARRRRWACDAVMWGFMGTYCPAEDAAAARVVPRMASCLALDAGSLFNDARGDAAAANVKEFPAFHYTPFGLTGHRGGTEVRLPEADCQRGVMYATRDIQPGEEFRYEYDLTFESDDVTFHHEYEPCLGESAEEEEETEKEEAEEDEDGPISDEL